MNIAAGAPTRFVQIGTWSLLFLALVAMLVVPTTARSAPLVAIVAAIILISVAIMIATLTIEIDDAGIAWYFTGRILYRRIDFGDLESCKPRGILPLGFGYRMGFKKRAWIATGLSAIAIHDRVSDNDLIVSCDSPAVVCAEIERRRAHR